MSVYPLRRKVAEEIASVVMADYAVHHRPLRDGFVAAAAERASRQISREAVVQAISETVKEYSPDG